MENNPNQGNPKQGQQPNAPGQGGMGQEKRQMPNDPNRQGQGGGQQGGQRPNQGQPNNPVQQPPRKG